MRPYTTYRCSHQCLLSDSEHGLTLDRYTRGAQEALQLELRKREEAQLVTVFERCAMHACHCAGGVLMRSA